MVKEVCIGKIEFKLGDFEKEESKILYKVSSRQKVKNIIVDCKYFEGKPNEYTGVKDISFLVEIKAFDHPNEPLHWYEIYSNGNDSRYDHINCFVNSVEKELERGSKEAEKFNKFIRTINDNFDEYIVTFVNNALQNIKNPKKYTSTPQFIKIAMKNIRKAENVHSV